MSRVLDRYPIALAYVAAVLAGLVPPLLFRTTLSLEVAFSLIAAAAAASLLLMVNAILRRQTLGAVATLPILIVGGPLFAMWVLTTNCAIRTNCF